MCQSVRSWLYLALPWVIALVVISTVTSRPAGAAREHMQPLLISDGGGAFRPAGPIPVRSVIGPSGASERGPAGSVLAQPSNDNIDSAVPISGPGAFYVPTNVNATNEPGEPIDMDCGDGWGTFTMWATIWYKYTADYDRPITVTLSMAANQTYKIASTAVYSGPGGWGGDWGSLGRLGCSATGEPVTVDVGRGQTVYFQLGTFHQTGCECEFFWDFASLSFSGPSDTTPPTITYQGRTPANGNGWNNGDVVLAWACADSFSKPVAPTVTQTRTAEGQGQSATGTCTDWAGNSSTDTQSGINIDRTPPNLTPSAKKADNTTYTPGTWTNQTVTVHFGCTDPLLTSGQAGSGVASVTSDTSVSSEGSNLSASGSCTDNAGNTRNAAFINIKIDKTVPTISRFNINGSQPVPNGPWVSALATTSLSINLVVAATDPAPSGGVTPSGVGKVQTSNYQGAAPVPANTWVDGSNWAPNANSSMTIPYTLPAGPDGSRKVWVRVVDAAGNPSTPSAASILLDTTTRSNGYGLSINGNPSEPATNVDPVQLWIGAPSGTTLMRIANDSNALGSAPWEPFNTRRNWPLPSFNVASYTALVYIEFAGPNGQLDPASQTNAFIIVDTTAPPLGSATINLVSRPVGASATYQVTATDDSGGVGMVKQKLDGTVIYGQVILSTDAAFTNPVTRTFTPPSGSNTATITFDPGNASAIYMKLRDAIGNLSSASSPKPLTVLNVQQTTIAVNSDLSVSWNYLDLPSTTNWIGLYHADPGTYAPDTAPVSGQFLPVGINGQTPDAGGTTTFRVGASVPSGPYELRLYRQQPINAADLLARSTTTFSVTGGPTITSTPTSTRTPTPTPTRTLTPTVQSSVGVQVTPDPVNHLLRATIAARSAGCAVNGQLQAISITRVANATVDLGALGTITAPTSAPIRLANTPSSMDMTVRRGPNPSAASTVEFTVTDGCGDWPSFVGAGPGAF